MSIVTKPSQILVLVTPKLRTSVTLRNSALNIFPKPCIFYRFLQIIIAAFTDILVSLSGNPATDFHSESALEVHCCRREGVARALFPMLLPFLPSFSRTCQQNLLCVNHSRWTQKILGRTEMPLFRVCLNQTYMSSWNRTRQDTSKFNSNLYNAL